MSHFDQDGKFYCALSFLVAVAKIPSGLVECIKLQYPHVMDRMIRMIGEKLLESWRGTGEMFDRMFIWRIGVVILF